MGCDRKVMRLIFIYQSFYNFFQTSLLSPFKMVPLGSYTLMKMLFPLLVAALEVFNHCGVQHVRYTLLDVF